MNHPTLRHSDLADIAKHLDHRNYQDDGERITDVLPPLMNGACRWTEDREYGWDTACGHTFVFIDDGPASNGFRYCCFCGQPLQPEPLTENDHETAP